MSSCTATKSARLALARLAIVLMFFMCFLATARSEAESEKSLKHPPPVPAVVPKGKDGIKKTVVSPNHFHGQASLGYAAAKACPEVIDQLFCYCGCDLSEAHHTLLDCFTSDHGAYCDDCQEESILAHKLHNNGVSMKVIQETIDKKFSHDYPFQKHSPRYQQYLDSRLYLKDLKASSPLKAGTQTSASKTRNTLLPAAAHVALPAAHTTADAKLKSGKSIGKCCAQGEHLGGNKL